MLKLGRACRTILCMFANKLLFLPKNFIFNYLENVFVCLFFSQKDDNKAISNLLLNRHS